MMLIFGLYGQIRLITSFRDNATVQMLIIQTTVLIVLASTLADLVQARLDPTVR